MSSIGFLCLELGPLLVALFGKVVKPLEGVVLMEKMGHWEQALRLFLFCVFEIGSHYVILADLELSV